MSYYALKGFDFSYICSTSSMQNCTKINLGMKTSTCKDGTLNNQPNKMGMAYFYIIPTSCMCHLHAPVFVLKLCYIMYYLTNNA